MQPANAPQNARRFQPTLVSALFIAATFAAIVPGGAAAQLDVDTGNAPNLTNAYFLDVNGNGRFDHVVLEFAPNTANNAGEPDDDDISPFLNSIRPSDFKVGAGASQMIVRGCYSKALAGDVCDAGPFQAPLPSPTGGFDGDPATTPLEIALILQESIQYQTGGTLPAVSYTPGTLVDEDGEAMPADSTVTLHDRAAPVFTAAYAKEGDNTIHARFSETVQNIGVAGSAGFPPIIPATAGDAAFNIGDVCYLDGTAASGTSSDFVQTKAQEESTASITGATASIGIQGVNDPGERGVNDQGDADVLDADDINKAVTVASVGFGDEDDTGCATAAVQDAAGLNLAAAGAPPGAGARPITKLDGNFVAKAGATASVFTDVGGSKAWIIFNGPVSSPTGNALGVDAFQYANDFLSGATGIASVTHVAGSNIVQLNLQGTVVSGDIGVDKINIVANKVAASGDTDNVLPAYTTGGTPDALPLTNSAVTASPGFAPLNTNLLEVYPVVASTVDADLNGLIDAVLIVFSAQVDATTLGSDAAWHVKKLNGKNAPTTVAVKAGAAGTSSVTSGGNCGQGTLPTLANAVYVCLVENAARGTGTELVIGHDATEGTQTKDVGGGDIASFAHLTVNDGARPIPTGYTTLDADNNGQIDRLVFTFSEPVDDSTFNAAEWTALDYGPNAALGGGDDTTYAIGASLDTTIAADVDDDAVIYLQLTESGTPDTEIVPKTKFARGATGLTDLKGRGAGSYDMTNLVADEINAEPTAADKALPVIVSAKTQAGSTTVLVTFSENVDNSAGAGAKLDFNDFVWRNLNSAGASGVNAVQHTPNTDTATLTIDAALTAADFSGDKLTVNSNSVFDAADNAGNQVEVGFTASGGPTLVSVKTLDVGAGSPPSGNPDGYLDGVELTFSANLDDDSGLIVDNPANPGSCIDNFELGEFTIKLGSITLATATDGMTISTDIDDRNGDCVTDTANTFDGVDDTKMYIFFDGDLNDNRPVGTIEGWTTAMLPNVNYAPDSVGGFLRALSDGSPVASFNKDTVDGAGPVLLTLSGSIGSTTATVTFSEGVVGSGTGGKLHPADFVYHNVVAGGGTDTSSMQVSHTAGDATATLTFNQKVDTAEFANPNGDEIEAKATIKDAKGVAAPAIRLGFKDLSAPVLVSVETVDNFLADGTTPGQNGLIDHLKLTFSEPLADGAACGNIDHTATGNPWTVKLGTTTIVPADIYTEVGGTCDGTGADDAVIFMKITESPASNPVLHSGVTPTVAYDSTKANALIVDKATPTANKLGTIATLSSVDKAIPVLWDADGKPNNAKQAATQDLDGDGKLDAFRLVFSEPVLDSSFRTQEWLIEDSYVGVGGKPNDPHVIDASNLGTANDAVLTIRFSEGTIFDTEDDPQITYTNIIGFSDLVGNELPTQGTAAIVEVDRARPALVNLATGAGLTIAQIEFSEPVGKTQAHVSPADDLAAADFDYVNGNGAGATGLLSVSVTGGAESGTLTFNAAVTAEDLDQDTIRAVTGAIVDASNNAANFAPLKLSGIAADTTKPATITDLAVTPGEESLKLEWTAPADTDLDFYEIRISDSALTAANFASAPLISQGTFADAATAPVPAAGAEQTVTITKFTDLTKTYFVGIITTDTTGNPSEVSNFASGQPLPPDGGIPGDISGFKVTSTTANSISVEWTAPADDAGVAASGPVTSYEVKISTTAITAANYAAASAATVTFDPATLAAPGAIQKALITQIAGAALAPDTTYHIAVKALDEKDQASATAPSVNGKTAMLDITPPTGSLAIMSSTHVAGTATQNNDPTFSWSGLTDEESTITYYYILDQVATTTVSASVTGALSGNTAATTASFTDVAPGTWYFHVIGISQGGSGTTAHYEIVIEAPVAVDFTSKLTAANNAIRGLTTVQQDGDDNVISWTLPTTEDEIAGVQIWRSTSPFTLIQDFVRGSAEFTAGTFTDADAPAGAVYLVTVYFLADASGGKFSDLDNVPGYQGLSEDEQKDLGVEPKAEESDDGLSTWVWLAIVIGGVLLLALIVFLIIRATRGGKKDEGNWDDGNWDDGADTWDDEAEAAPAGDAWDDEGAWDDPQPEEFQMECPDCDHVFTAVGVKPLTTKCPNCGVKGILN